MKILGIKIREWRNFRNIDFDVPANTPLVALVGENGTGKSNILELIAAAASHVGISPGIQLSRGNPFEEPHDVSVLFQISVEIYDLLTEEQTRPLRERNQTWNGQIRLDSQKSNNEGQKILATAIGEAGEDIPGLAHFISKALRERSETYYLGLDADRSYPPLSINDPQYAQALSLNWESIDQKKRRAHFPTRTMYEEWTRYFLGRETQVATEFQREYRRSRRTGSEPPAFKDIFDSYRESVTEVLPHLNFVGVDTSQKTLVFDSAGLELRFTNLSGGEREIAFIIGQIERFQLRNGILLIDEPELHLNPDLLRSWIAYLKDTIVDGQIWIGTHSLEAVEATGPSSTFVLERAADTRLVENVASLANRPVLSVLSAAVGSPAFSLKNLKFIFIEGDRQGRERDRFYRLSGEAKNVRFIEGGGCSEVIRKLKAVSQLAEDADDQIVVGGVVDRDFRTEAQIEENTLREAVFTLDCHEVENLFLQPEALQMILDRNGIEERALEKILEVTDRFAGRWILQRFVSISDQFQEVSRRCRQIAHKTPWLEFEVNLEAASSGIAAAYLAMDNSLYHKFIGGLQESAQAYRDLRESQDLWKHCFGKETLSSIPPLIGVSSIDVLQSNVISLWNSGEVLAPQELVRLREYVDELGQS